MLEGSYSYQAGTPIADILFSWFMASFKNSMRHKKLTGFIIIATWLYGAQCCPEYVFIPYFTFDSQNNGKVPIITGVQWR